MSLLLGIATYNGQVHYDTLRGLVQTSHYCGKAGIGVSIELRPHDAFIGKARSIIATKFLKSDFHDLLFIDADVGFSVLDVIKICKAPGDVAMGLYRLKDDGPDETKKVKYPALMCNPIERHEEDQSLIKLEYGPAGFLRIRKPVLEAMVEKWPTEWFTDDINGKVYDFFPAGRSGNSFVGEDISFCNRVRECGFDIWAVQGLELNHYGEKKWPAKWEIDVQVPVFPEQIEEREAA